MLVALVVGALVYTSKLAPEAMLLLVGWLIPGDGVRRVVSQTIRPPADPSTPTTSVPAAPRLPSNVDPQEKDTKP